MAEFVATLILVCMVSAWTFMLGRMYQQNRDAPTIRILQREVIRLQDEVSNQSAFASVVTQFADDVNKHLPPARLH